MRRVEKLLEKSKDNKNDKESNSIQCFEDGSSVMYDPIQYIDKTPFIKRILESKERVIQLIFPSGFGKSKNLYWLQLYACHTREHLTLFDRCKIGREIEFKKNHKSRYTVINLSFKNFSAKLYEDHYKNPLLKLADVLYQTIISALNGECRDSFHNHNPRRIPAQEPCLFYRRQSLSMAVKYAYDTYKKPVIVIIDDADFPLIDAKEKFYNASVLILTELINATINSPHLYKIIIASHFGLPNIHFSKSYSFLDDMFSNDFGLNKEEMQYLISIYFREIKESKRAQILEYLCSCIGQFQVGSKQVFESNLSMNHIISTFVKTKYLLSWDNLKKYVDQMGYIHHKLSRADPKTQRDFVKLVYHDTIISTLNPIPYKHANIIFSEEFWWFLAARGCISVNPLGNKRYQLQIQNTYLHQKLKLHMKDSILKYNHVKKCLSIVDRIILERSVWNKLFLCMIPLFIVSENLKNTILLALIYTIFTTIQSKLDLTSWWYEKKFTDMNAALKILCIDKNVTFIELQKKLRKKMNELELLPEIRFKEILGIHNNSHNFYLFKSTVDRTISLESSMPSQLKVAFK